MSTNELMHYGTKMHSGRFPWGSGENPYQRLDKGFSDTVAKLKKGGLTPKEIVTVLRVNSVKDLSDDVVNSLKGGGLSEKEIAKALELKSINQLRAYKTFARENQRKKDRDEVLRLKEQGLNNSEIGRKMGINESSVRSLLDESIAKRTDQTRQTANELKKYVNKNKYVDIGPGTELELGVTSTKLKTAVAMLEEEGYQKHFIKVKQMGTDNYTTVTALVKPGVEYKETLANKDKIKLINEKTYDVDGNTLLGMPPKKEIIKSSVDSKRIEIVGEEYGGKDKDGVIELRRGVDDISLGKNQYCQVRIPVDGKYYLKGMAIYSDDLPKGVDIRVYSKHSQNLDKVEHFKKMKLDEDNPFGASIKGEDDLKNTSRYYTDKDGKKKLSAVNIVYEEGDWGTWSKTLASQMLSKQSVSVAKKQLDLAYADKVDEYNTINKLTNPSVKKALLDKFADNCDSSAVDLKAAALPRQASKVLLPIKSLKDHEIYAPDLPNGEEVVLVRYPHGGQFEMPRLIVNNHNKEANKIMKNAIDAVGININVAGVLSGADFDGDTALVIPTTRNGRKTVNIQTKEPLKGLKGFDTSEYYSPAYDKEKGGKPISNKTKQIEMGKVTNLIADMTIKGAKPEELSRAVRHSMVIIDSEKHSLDYKQSEKDSDIRSLKRKYQDGGGASTIITRASSELRVPKRKRAYKANPETGEIEYIQTPETYINKAGKKVESTTKTTRMAEAKDARTLMSKEAFPIERVYADYANKCKALANASRKQSLAISEIKRNPSAAKVYSKEVDSLNAKLNEALKNAPKERKAQTIANVVVAAKKRDNPNMDGDTYKKIKGQALGAARARVGAKKQKVSFTDREWEAVQAGAIGSTKLKKLLSNADLDEIKKLATPRKTKASLSNSQIARIKAMSNSTYSIEEIAQALGISPSTVSKYLK